MDRRSPEPETVSNARLGRTPRLSGRALVTICLVGLGVTSSGCLPQRDANPTTELRPGEVVIPAPSDWTDHGAQFGAGEPGEWDHLLYGGFASTVIKRDGTYHLYYQGSDSLRSEYDETVCHRSIGLARGGSDFTLEKYPENPVLTWLPTSECEEGAAAGAAVVGEDETVFLYYGANTLTSRTTVSSDIRLARSSDGVDFRDVGIVLDRLDEDVWGHGDELFPLLALRTDDLWIVYYVPNGSPQRRQLGVASGPTPGALSRTRQALGPKRAVIPVWGPMGFGRIGEDRYALFLKDGPKAPLEVRIISADAPWLLSDPVHIYPHNGEVSVTVMLDEESDEWVMVYRRGTQYGVKTAPVVRVPTAPE